VTVNSVRMYQSEDGTLHEDITLARKHDAQYRVMSKVKDVLAKATPSRQFNLLALDLANNPKTATELRDALNKVLEYHRHYGKLKN
jgi:bifunctional pyridoxal-dependent enzyme with beta-cystathionase and maltose regulon repressor activities